jgi:hypothetical protein
MTDVLTGYAVPAGAGLAGGPDLKASQPSTGGALSVFETSVRGRTAPALSTTARMNASTCWTASYPSAVRATPSAPRRAVSSSCPAGARTGFWAADQPARLLLIAVPGGIEDHFHQD